MSKKRAPVRRIKKSTGFTTISRSIAYTSAASTAAGMPRRSASPLCCSISANTVSTLDPYRCASSNVSDSVSPSRRPWLTLLRKNGASCAEPPTSPPDIGSVFVRLGGSAAETLPSATSMAAIWFTTDSAILR
ncbi:hypothetical protein D3C84_898520 [compost metagenome]